MKRLILSNFLFLTPYFLFSQNVGIGTSNPSLAGLVVDAYVGNVNALFGSNTTGVSIISNYPGIGLNTYYNNGHKAISTGYGGLIDLDPVFGGMGLYVTNASYNTGAPVSYNKAITIKPNGSVGIGVATPDATFEVMRGTGLHGTAKFNGTTHASHFNHFVAEHTYIRAGKDNGYVIINDIPGGKVGIGIAPEQNLSVKNGMNIDQENGNNGTLDNNVLRFGGGGSGEAISSPRTGGSGNQYGLSFYTASANRMIITNSGNVGIGTTNADFKLDVGGRIRLRSAGGSNTAGVYLNSVDNSSLPAFIGMDDDTHVGFWGIGAGWKFTMNTQTGALKINGSEGSAGQVLRSNGNSSPSWSNPLGELFSNMATVYENGYIDVGPGPLTDLPGMSNIPFTITSTSKVLVSLSADLLSLPPSTFSYSAGYVQGYIYQQGNPSAIALFAASACIPTGTTVSVTTGMKCMPSLNGSLGPGNYYFRVAAFWLGGPAIRVDDAAIDYIIIRQ